jgi:hypothetical protein
MLLSQCLSHYTLNLNKSFLPGRCKEIEIFAARFVNPLAICLHLYHKASSEDDERTWHPLRVRRLNYKLKILSR